MTIKPNEQGPPHISEGGGFQLLRRGLFTVKEASSG
jgi:hypothetical protein